MGRKKSVFREKNMETINSPDRLNDYIRVSTPSVWIVLAAVTFLLIGILVWGVFGTLEMNRADGSSKIVHPISFVVN